MLQYIPLYFQWLALAIGDSMRHKCNMKRQNDKLAIVKWEGNEAKGEAPRPVAHYIDWPAPGEPISDDIGSQGSRLRSA
jgi:hypothetical protein